MSTQASTDASAHKDVRSKQAAQDHQVVGQYAVDGSCDFAIADCEDFPERRLVVHTVLDPIDANCTRCIALMFMDVQMRWLKSSGKPEVPPKG